MYLESVVKMLRPGEQRWAALEDADGTELFGFTPSSLESR
jgi:hypothetical protein